MLTCLPLVALWLVALAAGAVLDLFKLPELEFEAHARTLGLLRVVACSVCLSLVFAYLLSLVSRWAPVRYALAFLAFLVIGFDLFLRANYGSRMTPEIATFIAETNRVEASEYLATYLWPFLKSPKTILLVSAMVLWVVLDRWWMRRVCTRSFSRRTEAVAVLMLCGALIGAACAPSTWSIATSLVRGDNRQYSNAFGLDDVSNMLFCWQRLAQTDRLTSQSVAATLQACQEGVTKPDNAPTVVLVIGESYIKSHAAVYGYPLPTTPYLCRERDNGNLVVFTDAVSPFNNTNWSIRYLLSMNSIADGEPWQDCPLFPAIFKVAGYHVEMWDNQREMFEGSDFTRGLNGFLYNPQVIRLCYDWVNDKNYKYDAELVNDYVNTHNQDGSSPRLVIFHLRGQHLKAANRYPHEPQYEHFGPDDYGYRNEPYLTDKMKRDIAHYDNATLYNDEVLSMIFDAFSQTDAVVVCLSDHGDEIYDYRPCIGRQAESVRIRQMLDYQYGIPFFVWCSSDFKSNHPEIFSRIAAAANRPLMTDNLGQILLGIAGVEAGCYRPSRDVVSDNYRPSKRWVGNAYDYDRDKPGLVSGKKSRLIY